MVGVRVVAFVSGQDRRRCARYQISVRSSSSRRQPPIQRSMMEFIRGMRTPDLTIRNPAATALLR